MKRLVQSPWLLAVLALLAAVLVACERPINPDSADATAEPILPATLVVPTADPLAAPTTDPLAQPTAVPDDPTNPPDVEATTEPGSEATAVPETNEPRGEVSHTIVAGDRDVHSGRSDG